MLVANAIRKNEYRDSVILMRASERLRAMDGVVQAALMMGTDGNKRMLSASGLLSPEGRDAQAVDLIVALQAIDQSAIDGALDQLNHILQQQAERLGGASVHSLDSAIRMMPHANLVLISVPGEFAAREARRALEKGLHVFLFSDGVPLQDEVELKAMARKRGLLVMGPECGTSIVNNVGIGFANAVRPGTIGIVSASGTGLQEVSVQVHRHGLGISQAIGVGGRDLSDEVGGASTLQALEVLGADSETSVIVLLSKPPSPSTRERVCAAAAQCGKPVVVHFLGWKTAQRNQGSLLFVETLEAAALAAVATADSGTSRSAAACVPGPHIQKLAAVEAAKLCAGQQYVRGLFSGGTLCYEAMGVVSDLIGEVYSNEPLEERFRLPDAQASYQHSFVDMGAGVYTRGRPHPMIDPTLRQERILQEAADPQVAVLLLDVVLGYGCHPDPAGALQGAIVEARAQARGRGAHLAAVASICGTDGDTQGLELQEARLRDAGVTVASSNAEAARLAGMIAQHAAGPKSRSK